jgi:hypothetical protein
MKTTMISAAIAALFLFSCSDSDGDQMDCKRAVQEQLEKDLAAEDAAVQYRLEHEVLTGDQKLSILSSSAKYKEAMRKAATAREGTCN